MPTGNSRYLYYQSYGVNGEPRTFKAIDGVTGRQVAPNSSPTTNLLRRMATLNASPGVIGIGTAIGGGIQAYDEAKRALAPRTDYTPFTPEYRR